MYYKKGRDIILQPENGMDENDSVTLLEEFSKQGYQKIVFPLISLFYCISLTMRFFKKSDYL